MPAAAVRGTKTLELPEPGMNPGPRHLHVAQRAGKAVLAWRTPEWRAEDWRAGLDEEWPA